MIGHVIKIYRNSGLKPALKAALHDLGAGASRRRQALFYARSLFSEEQREGTQLLEYCIVKTGDVKLHRDMVCELDKVIEEKRPAVIYMDELRDGELLYKPDYAPDNLMAHNYIGNCVVVRRDLMDDCAVKLSREDSLWSFNKYICGRCREEEIAHVSRALFEDNGHISEDGDKTWSIIKDTLHDSEKDLSIENIKDTFTDCIKDTSTDCIKDILDDNIEDTSTDNMKDCIVDSIDDGFGDVSNSKYCPMISVIIPNYEHADDLRRCVESLLYINSYKNIEIIIVENNSTSEEIFSCYDELLREHPDVIRLEKWEGSFNYSAINNYGASRAKGELLLLLNNDTKIIEPDSLWAMTEYAVRDNTGAVGACLLYENKTVQHAGVIVGIGPDRTAVHPNSGVCFIENGYRDSIHHVQNYSAVTGACLMIKKELFDKLGGLDEKLAVAYNDVDFCLRLRRRGLLNVYVPQALLFHYESKSRGYDDKGERHERFLRESQLFRDRWQNIIDDGDPYYNVNLSKEVPWKPEIKL